jgi:hypothetical protein
MNGGGGVADVAQTGVTNSTQGARDVMVPVARPLCTL